MVRPELPDNWQDLAAGYVLNNLSDEEAADWETLLAQHPELSNELEALHSTFNLFAETVPLHQPPDRLLDRIRAASHTLSTVTISEKPLLTHSVSPVTRSNHRLTLIGGIGGAIAAGLIAVLGIQLASVRAQLQQANQTIDRLNQDLAQAQTQVQSARPVVQSLQQPGTRVYSLEGSTLANAASGRLLMSDRQQVTILVQNLPELPEEKVYRLWAAVPTTTQLIYCGQFNSNRQGVIQLTPSSNRCAENPTQMFITIDAVTDPTTRGGPVVMQGRI